MTEKKPAEQGGPRVSAKPIINASAPARNPLLAAALDYAERDWRVLPLHGIGADGQCTCGETDCESPGKHPRLKNWQKHATTDREQIRSWWSRWPGANPGLATGPESGLLVLDVDDLQAGRNLGREEWRIAAERALVAVTGRGAHLYFSWLPELDALKTQGARLRPGLDVRGRGGYVVAPPSTHASGKVYQWVAERGPDGREPGPPPARVLDLLRDRQRPAAVNGAQRPDVPGEWDIPAAGTGTDWPAVEREGVEAGGRNDALARLVGHLLADGVDPAEAMERARAFAGRCRPPMDVDEVGATVRSIARKELEGRGVEAPPEDLDAIVIALRNHPRPGTEGGEDGDENTGGRRSVATRLVDLARGAGAELWHTPDDEAYATIVVAGHREHWPVRSRGCRSWLARLLWQAEQRAAPSQAMQDAIGVLEGLAVHEGGEHPAHVRAAWHEGRIYLDLGDEAWRGIEVSPAGWRIVADPPVRFRRPRGLAPLPEPAPGGDLDELRELLGWDDGDAWVAVASWLAMTYRPSGPYPVLMLRGPQGSGKSTVARAIRALADPSTVPLRTTPRAEQDLLIAARNGWVVAADNLSGCPPWLSDAICRLATGGGWSARQLYTDAEEVLIDACRPIMLTGIDLAPERQDLLDRAVIVDVPEVRERRDESTWWAEYDRLQPRVLGVLLDAAAQALRQPVAVPDPPRMADYAAWIASAEPALGWPAGRGVEVYRGQRRDAVRTALDGSPLAAVLVRWLGALQVPAWRGEPGQLYSALCSEAQPAERQARSWPGSAAAMTSQLTRLAPGLAEAEGVTVVAKRAHGGRRVVTVSRAPEEATA